MTEENDKYFAVTDQHVIIPLRVIDVEEVELGDGDNIFRIETEVVGEVTSHMECHHRIYFRDMWLDDSGLPDKGNVFVDKKDAVTYAIKRAENEQQTHKMAINGIQKQIAKLRKDI